MRRLLALAVVVAALGGGIAHAALSDTPVNPAYSATTFIGPGPALNCPANGSCAVTRQADDMVFTTPAADHAPVVTVTLNFQYKTGATGYYYLGIEGYADSGDSINWKPSRRRIGVSTTITTTTLMFTFPVGNNTRYTLRLEPDITRTTNTKAASLDINDMLIQVEMA